MRGTHGRPELAKESLEADLFSESLGKPRGDPEAQGPLVSTIRTVNGSCALTILHTSIEGHIFVPSRVVLAFDGSVP